MKAMFAAFMIVGMLTYSGCMMMGMHGEMHGDSRHDKSPPVILQRVVKEVLVGDYRLVAEFPPLTLHCETSFTLRVYSPEESLVSEALVRIQISTGTGEHQGHTQIEQVLEEKEVGVYEHLFIPHSEGTYHVRFLVEGMKDLVLKQPIMLESTLQAMAESVHHSSGSNLTPLLIVGGVTMAVMMILMMGWGFF